MATIGVIREAAPTETRVALTPEVTARLVASGLKILVESGAGERAIYLDAAYAEAGAVVVSTADLHAGADVLLCVSAPDGEPEIDTGDELQAAMVVCRDGEPRNDAVRALLGQEEGKP